MKRICTQCQGEMIEDCDISVEGSFNGVSIKKKAEGLFNWKTGYLKAAVCTNCGYVAFYMENYKDFVQHFI